MTLRGIAAFAAFALLAARNKAVLTLLVVAVFCAGYAIYVRMPRFGSTFEVSISDAKKALAKMDPPPAVFGSGHHDFNFESPEPTKIVWTIKESGSAVMRFTADLAAVTDHSTRIKVSVSGPADGPNQQVGKRLEQYPTVRHLYIVAMEEQIAASIENRSFSFLVIVVPTAVAVLANMGALSSQMDGVAENSRNTERANIAKAYANEAARVKSK